MSRVFRFARSGSAQSWMAHGIRVREAAALRSETDAFPGSLENFTSFLWRCSAGHLRADFFEEVYPGKPNRVMDRSLTCLLQLG